MTAKTKANVISASLDTAFVDGISASISTPELSAFDSDRYVVFPGFCDVHVHFREPGFARLRSETGLRAQSSGND